MDIGNATGEQMMPRLACDQEDWPWIIHRLWRVAQVERTQLVVDLVWGNHFVIGPGSIATRADCVECVDEDCSKTLLSYAENPAVLLTG
jgi:hypothetical protein